MTTEASASASVAITAANVRGPNPKPPTSTGSISPSSPDSKRHDNLGRESSRLIVLPCGGRQHAIGNLPGFQNGRVMSHHRSNHPQIYWIKPGLSPRMRGLVKQSLAVAGPQSPGKGKRQPRRLFWRKCARMGHSGQRFATWQIALVLTSSYVLQGRLPILLSNGAATPYVLSVSSLLLRLSPLVRGPSWLVSRDP